MDHRLAALLGRTVEEMRESLSQRAYMKWCAYWDAEPWGPWRDNLHAALICKEIRRPQVAHGSRIDLDQFMVEQPKVRLRKAEGGLWNFLTLVAKKVVGQ